MRVAQGYLRSINFLKEKPSILFFTKSHVWANLAPDLRNDPNFYTITSKLTEEKNYNPLVIDVAVTVEGAWKGLKEKKWPYFPYDYFYFRSFFDSKLQKKMDLLEKNLSLIWKDLEKNDNFRTMLDLDGISTYDVLKRNLHNYFTGSLNSFLSAARNFEVSKKIINDFKINAVVSVDENGSARPFIFAAKILKVPSLGLQHGNIFPVSSIAYKYGAEDISKYKGNLNCFLPDKTAVYGQYFKDLLVSEGNYNKKDVVVTGHPRFDLLNERKNDKDAVLEKLGIDEGKKIVLYASQPMKLESKVAFTSVIKALKKIKEAFLIVKLHPADDENMYRQILKSENYHALITRNADLYELLSCSDAVIAIQSTVILEALMMRKPVIQLNLMEQYKVAGDLRAII